MWRAREVDRALDLIDHLGPTSHYVAAVSDDDELGEMLAERSGNGGPALTEWSTEVQHLAVIADVLLSLRASFLQANGAKGVQTPKPLPRPSTAAQRWRDTKRNDVRSFLRSRLLPGELAQPAPLLRPDEFVDGSGEHDQHDQHNDE